MKVGHCYISLAGIHVYPEMLIKVIIPHILYETLLHIPLLSVINGLIFGILYKLFFAVF